MVCSLMHMFHYLVVGANRRSVQFIKTILRLTKKNVMLLDDRIEPLKSWELYELQQYTNFYFIFSYKISSIRSITIPYEKYVLATYDSNPIDIFKNKRIVLQNILINEEALSADIIAKVEALGIGIELHALAKDWTKYSVHYLNLWKLKKSSICDILLDKR